MIDLMSNPQTTELADVCAELEMATPQEILRWAIETYRDKLTMATAFGAEGCCLIDMIAGIRDATGLAPDIFNLETGYQFPETLELRERMQERYDLNIRLVSSHESVETMEARLGGPIYNRNPDLCCNLRKVRPLSQAVQGFDAWITAIRRDQTPERSTAPIVGRDAKFGLVKVNPLANWTKTQVWDYLYDNEVPFNPLHLQGFPSIGCWPCTRAVEKGEDDRAGRWAGTVKRECGLHLAPNGKLVRARA